MNSVCKSAITLVLGNLILTGVAIAEQASAGEEKEMAKILSSNEIRQSGIAPIVALGAMLKSSEHNNVKSRHPFERGRLEPVTESTQEMPNPSADPQSCTLSDPSCHK